MRSCTSHRGTEQTRIKAENELGTVAQGSFALVVYEHGVSHKLVFENTM
jgi:hypothetical protein